MFCSQEVDQTKGPGSQGGFPFITGWRDPQVPLAGLVFGFESDVKLQSQLDYFSQEEALSDHVGRGVPGQGALPH